jgi:predicted phage baseplate assembly protein
MSLPAPNLDVRDFQEIVDDVKRQIGLRCPEWSEHNVSDPGVTLIELFAYMCEMMLFRMNQVPERNYVKFLEMLGITLEMPQPATTDLRFRLSRPIADDEGAEENEITLRARETVAATVRTENEEAIEFATERDLRLVRPRLSHIFAAPAVDGEETDEDAIARAQELDSKKMPLPENKTFKVFSAKPLTGDCLYLGFEADISGNMIGLEVQCLTAAATGLNEDYPSQVWEYWNAVSTRWDRLEVASDSTYGFNRNGIVELAMPDGLAERVLGGRRAFWVRCRYTVDTEDLPPRGVEQRRPDPYQKPPELTSLRATVTGGTVTASNCTSIRNETLGQSDGTPGQVFKLRNSPILELRGEETVLVGPIGDSPEDMTGWTPWTRVADFSESGSDDRHFACDTLTGEIYFGPNIPQPDGSGRQYGAIPEKGHSIGISAYRYGGGTEGNVRENKVRILKTSLPYIAEVVNPNAAQGGRDRETLERAKMRAREVLQVRNRAVTADDFEFLAQKASSAVGRARCIQPVSYPLREGDAVGPGTVRVLLVPALSDAITVPRPADLRIAPRTAQDVKEYLDRRRLLTTVLEVGEPEYVYVSIDVKLVADPRADADVVARRVVEKLTLFLHPLRGGPSGTGWPFRRALTLADVYAQVGEVRGVAFLLDAKMFASRIVNREEGLLGPEQPLSNAEGLRLEENELICSRQHNARVVPMSAVGADESVSAT